MDLFTSSAAALTSYFDNVNSHWRSQLGLLHPQNTFEISWRYLCANYSYSTILIWGSFVFQLSALAIASLPSVIFSLIPYLQQYKIQRDKSVSLAEHWQALRRVTLSTFVTLPITTLSYVVMEFHNYRLPYMYEDMPTLFTICTRLIMCLYIEDTWHYFWHRAMHHPSIFQYIHITHHAYRTPFSLAAQFAHPLETMMLGIGFAIPLMLFLDHLYMFWSWLLVRVFEAADVHSGYDIPFYVHPLKLLPFFMPDLDFMIIIILHMEIISQVPSTFGIDY